MQNILLRNIIDQSCADLRSLALDGEGDILNALHRAVAEAELQETKPKFTLSFSVAIDPDKGNYETKLSWTVKQSLSVEHTIEDANQENLPLEGTITFKTEGMDPVTLTNEQLQKAAKKLSGK